MDVGEDFAGDFLVLGLDLEVDVGDVVDHLGELDEPERDNVTGEAGVFDVASRARSSSVVMRDFLDRFYLVVWDFFNHEGPRRALRTGLDVILTGEKEGEEDGVGWTA